MEVLCYRGGKMNEKIKKYSPYILFIIVIVLMIVGIVSKKEDDYLATIYHLMRSLACELPHEPSREYLVNYFE